MFSTRGLAIVCISRIARSVFALEVGIRVPFGNVSSPENSIRARAVPSANASVAVLNVMIAAMLATIRMRLDQSSENRRLEQTTKKPPFRAVDCCT